MYTLTLLYIICNIHINIRKTRILLHTSVFVIQMILTSLLRTSIAGLKSRPGLKNSPCNQTLKDCFHSRK